MKKLLCAILSLVMILSFVACGNTDTPDTSESPEAETQVYKFEESHGSFSIKWTIELKSDGTFQITEVNGMSGDVVIHTGSSWTDNGDTFVTGEWDDKDSDKSDFFKPTGECTWVKGEDGTCTPEDYDPNASAGDGIQPGKYTYEEDRGDFKITWEVMLMGNSSFKISETHGLSGLVTEHTGSFWTDNGDGTATTGEWDNKEVDKSEFFKPTGECTWIINADGTCAPADAGESSGEGEATGVQAGKYTYIESKGPGDFKWEVLLMGNGNCRIDETNPSGEVTEHTAVGWVDNGDGTVTTGEWENKEVDKSDFFKPTGECTWKINADGTCEPVSGDAPTATTEVNPGKYTYIESKGPGDFKWEVLLMGNGNCRIDETNPSGEVTEHVAAGWTDNGDGTVTTGEWENKEVDKSDFFKPTGECTWKINADGTCEPVSGEAEGGEGEGTASVNPGKYAYIETKGPGDFKWEVLLMGNGNCRIDETMPSGEVVEHTAAGWTDNGDGTATTGAWEDASANKSDFFAADGSCTWKINADGTCEPIA